MSENFTWSPLPMSRETISQETFTSDETDQAFESLELEDEYRRSGRPPRPPAGRGRVAGPSPAYGAGKGRWGRQGAPRPHGGKHGGKHGGTWRMRRTLYPPLWMPWAGGPVPYPVAVPTDAPEDGGIGWAQDCLNRTLGLRLPLTGTLDPATRSALRIFQSQNGMTPDGSLSPAVRRALTERCSGSGDDGSPMDGGAAEEEEFHVRSNAVFHLKASGPYKISESELAKFPIGPGVYVIKSRNRVYVGQSKSIRGRFSTRLDVLREMILLESVKNHQVFCYTFSNRSALPKINIKSINKDKITKSNPNTAFKVVDNDVGSILHILEEGFIQHYKGKRPVIKLVNRGYIGVCYESGVDPTIIKITGNPQEFSTPLKVQPAKTCGQSRIR